MCAGLDGGSGVIAAKTRDKNWKYCSYPKMPQTNKAAKFMALKRLKEKEEEGI